MACIQTHMILVHTYVVLQTGGSGWHYITE